MAEPNSSIAEDIIIKEIEEGTCVCGQRMKKVSKHLNYVVWKCESCGRREPRWEGARPHSLSEASKQELILAGCSIFNNIEKVISGKNERQTDKNSAVLDDRW